MKDTIENLRKKIDSATELGSVVRTMKALAASSITQYENAVRSLALYYQTVEWGLAIAWGKRYQAEPVPSSAYIHPGETASAVIIFGSDLGLVGGFNESLGEFATKFLAALPGEKKIWAVGERISYHLADAGWHVTSAFEVPGSVRNITVLVGAILREILMRYEAGEIARVYTVHNQPGAAGFEPRHHCILPLDELWKQELTKLQWPSNQVPEIFGDPGVTLEALIREYLFVSVYRTCAESLASENASRLAAMQRAEKNIRERLDSLRLTFHRLRQDSIDEELFDILSGANIPD